MDDNAIHLLNNWGPILFSLARWHLANAIGGKPLTYKPETDFNTFLKNLLKLL